MVLTLLNVCCLIIIKKKNDKNVLKDWTELGLKL